MIAFLSAWAIPLAWCAVAVVLVLVTIAVLDLIDRPEPTGKHHQPHRPPWWQRIRDRRQHERAVDALNLRLLQDIGEGLRREATGPLTSSGMPRAEWPLMPLPPEVDEDADHFHRPLPPGPEMPTGILHYEGPALTPGQVAQFRTALWGAAEPEDPAEVVTPGDEADAYVGEYRADGAGEMVPKSTASLLGPAPEPAPLTDYREETGSWPALVDAVMPKDGA